MRSEFHALEFEFPEFTAVLDEMTKNMYVLVIVHDPHIGRLDPPLVHNSSSLAPAETAAIRINIELARRKFEELQSDSTLG
jgi:Ras-related GTP-binding protein A/B